MISSCNVKRSQYVNRYRSSRVQVAIARAATNEGAGAVQPAGHARKPTRGIPPGNVVSAFEGSSAHVPHVCRLTSREENVSFVVLHPPNPLKVCLTRLLCVT